MQNFSQNLRCDAIRYKGEGIFYFPFFEKDKLMLTPLFNEGEDIEFFGNEDNPTADWMGYSLAEAQELTRLEITDKVRQLIQS